LHNRFILVVIAIPCLVQWTLILRDVVNRRAIWDDVAQHCVVVPEPLPDSLFLPISAMVFDFLVLVIGAIGLFRQGPLRSKLQVIVFKHGLVYFIVTFAINLLAVAFIFASVSIAITVVSALAATFASTVVSCRVVRDLVLFAEDDERRHDLLPTTNPEQRQLPSNGSVGLSGPPILSTVVFSLGKPNNTEDNENTKDALHSEFGTDETL